MRVVDASVAPELLRYEIANVLVTKVRLPAASVADLFTYFLDLDIETYTLGAGEYRVSIDLGRRYGLTVYDASYLALALGLTVVTADRKLAARTARLRIVQPL